MDLVVAILLGLGLSASCGFRVFVPPLILGLASAGGYLPEDLELSGSFHWMDEPLTLGIFGVATVVEIAAMYIPWVANLLSVVLTPAAIGAGAVVTAAVVPESSGALSYVLPLVAGGAAGVVQAGTVGAHGLTAATTGGLGTPAVSTAETGGSIATAGGMIALAKLWAPIFIAIALFFLVLLAVGVWLIFRWRRNQAATDEASTSESTSDDAAPSTSPGTTAPPPLPTKAPERVSVGAADTRPGAGDEELSGEPPPLPDKTPEPGSAAGADEDLSGEPPPLPDKTPEPGSAAGADEDLSGEPPPLPDKTPEPGSAAGADEDLSGEPPPLPDKKADTRITDEE